MKERPILFSAPMVRALLDGRKTQTRRIVKIRGLDFVGSGSKDGPDWNDPSCWGFEDPNTGHDWALAKSEPVDHVFPSPYGQLGDRLWVKEAARVNYEGGGVSSPWMYGIEYKAGGPSPLRNGKVPKWFPSKSHNIDGTIRWQPSIHMPRWASRILLEVVSVRVERLNDISEADCYAEGIQIPCDIDGHPLICLSGKFPTSRYIENPRKATMRDLARAEYASLIESINGAGTWDANPWVWVVEFRRVD